MEKAATAFPIALHLNVIDLFKKHLYNCPSFSHLWAAPNQT